MTNEQIKTLMEDIAKRTKGSYWAGDASKINPETGEPYPQSHRVYYNLTNIAKCYVYFDNTSGTFKRFKKWLNDGVIATPPSIATMDAFLDSVTLIMSYVASKNYNSTQTLANWLDYQVATMGDVEQSCEAFLAGGKHLDLQLKVKELKDAGLPRVDDEILEGPELIGEIEATMGVESKPDMQGVEDDPFAD